MQTTIATTLLERVVLASELFANLTEEQVKEVMSTAKKSTRNKGDILVKRGQAMDVCYVIESGEVTKVRGETKTTQIQGDVLGILHFFGHDVASYDLTVSSETASFWCLHSEDFKETLRKSPEITEKYISFLNRKMRDSLNAMKTLTEPEGGSLRVAFYDSKPYMKDAFQQVAKDKKYSKISLCWFDPKLNENTVSLINGHQVVCVFVNDNLNADVISELNKSGVKMIALRCAGYNNVDLPKVNEFGLSITRVPAYSPYAVAEFAIGLMLSLNRKFHKAYQRVKEFNFSLNNLVGFDMRGKTVGVFGTGKIGYCTTEILLGFGCKVLACDVYPNEELKKKGVTYVEKDEILARSDIITMHAPLLKSTRHWLDKDALSKCKNGVMIINTSRGPLIDTEALVEAILSGKVGSAGLDVVEGEEKIFFENRETQQVSDNALSRLIGCPNVLLTSHQAFLTEDALLNIAGSTLDSILEFAEGKRKEKLTNYVKEEFK